MKAKNKAGATTPTEALAARVLGEERAAALRFEDAPAASYRAEGGRIVVAGPTEGDRAMALGAYLRDVAEGHWSWCGSRFPETLPLPAAPATVEFGALRIRSE